MWFLCCPSCNFKEMHECDMSGKNEVTCSSCGAMLHDCIDNAIDWSVDSVDVDAIGLQE